MKYSIKPKNDLDKENSKQLELIMNHKLATYDDISEVIKERVDNFEFKDKLMNFSKKLRFFLWLYKKEFIKKRVGSDVKYFFELVEILSKMEKNAK